MRLKSILLTQENRLQFLILFDYITTSLFLAVDSTQFKSFPCNHGAMF